VSAAAKAAAVLVAALVVAVAGIAAVSAAPDTAPTATVSVPKSNQGSCECLRGTVTVTATATASSGRAITSVEIQVAKAGTGSWAGVGTATLPPYSVNVDTSTLEAGPYDVRAVATDGTGEVGASAPARDRVVANNVAFVGLADPGAILHGTVKLTATSEEGQPIPTSVEFQRSPAGRETWATFATTTSETDADGNQLGRFLAQLDTSTVPDGPQDLRIVATDDTGQWSFVSGPLRERLIDNTAPDVTLADPGGRLSGVVTLTADANDPVAGIAAVRFERSPAGTGTWSPISADTRAPYTAVLDTRLLDDGRYDFRAVATDRASNTAASAAVTDVTVANPGEARPGALKIENVVAPARDLHLLGAVDGSAQHETWAYGSTDAGPASVGGEPLPYTAPGHGQLVLLRYTDDGGWQIADVLRNADGSAYRQLANGKLAVAGQMAPTGEAWLAVSQYAPGQASADVAVFHRGPGERFLLDPVATAVLRPFGTGNGAQGLAGASIRLGVGADGGVFGTLHAPNQPARTTPVLPPGGGRPVNVAAQLDFGVLTAGRWSRRTATLPPDFAPRSGEVVGVKALDPTAPDRGWAAVGRTATVPRRRRRRVDRVDGRARPRKRPGRRPVRRRRRRGDPVLVRRRAATRQPRLRGAGRPRPPGRPARAGVPGLRR
jgi:hypothetical protein